MYAMKMQPVFKDHIWGGTAFKDKYGKLFDGEKSSEAWEVSVHKNGSSIVDNGEFAGMPFDEAVRKLGRKLLGDYVYDKYKGEFPLLVKFLDCNDKLSVQVHPDDAYAQANEGEFGKTEMWYILDAKPDAKLVYGFSKDTNREEVKSAIESGDLGSLLNCVNVNVGDTFFVRAGTLHALYEGLLVAEIQQNSDTTYRVFDHNRIGADGQPRELHVEQSLNVLDYRSGKGMEKVCIEPVEIGENENAHLATCEQFSTYRYIIKEKIALSSQKQSFDILIFYNGTAIIEYESDSVVVKPGDSVVIPAYLGDYTITGSCAFLKSFVPYN